MDQECSGSPRTLREQMARQQRIGVKSARGDQEISGVTSIVSGSVSMRAFQPNSVSRERSRLRSLSPTLTPRVRWWKWSCFLIRYQKGRHCEDQAGAHRIANKL